MPYGDFKNRENVYEIISETLSEHYHCQVSIVNKFSRTSKKSKYYCFDRLGIIIPQKVCKEIRRQVRREYRITYSLGRKMVMDLYITAMFLLPDLLCNKVMLTEYPMLDRYIFIEPGNKKVKIINYHDLTITNIVKKGFHSEWIQNEIEMRSTSNKSYVFPLEKTDEGYKEALVNGYSYTRLRKTEQRAFANQVDAIIQDYSKKKHEKLPANQYLKKLIGQLNIKIEQNNLEVNSPYYPKLMRAMEILSDKISDSEIELVFSHGDLQPGNFFYSNTEQKMYLVDWETWGKRSSIYDLMLFYYGFRRLQMLKEKTSAYLSDRGEKLFQRKLSDKNLHDYLIIFFAEDILWQIAETKVLPENCVSNGIKVYGSDDFIEILENI